jgi:hypothetical protein
MATERPVSTFVSPALNSISLVKFDAEMKSLLS